MSVAGFLPFRRDMSGIDQLTYQLHQSLVLGALVSIREKRADIDLGRLTARRNVRLMGDYDLAVTVAAQVPPVPVGAAVEFSPLSGHETSPLKSVDRVLYVLSRHWKSQSVRHPVLAAS
jgi:hypothetical protein